MAHRVHRVRDTVEAGLLQNHFHLVRLLTNDVARFVQAMMDPAAYTLATGLAPTDACDMNGDGQADGKDIQDFVERIINMVRGAAAGEGLGNRFLAHIREVDAIVHVLRCFEDENVTHIEGTIDPAADAATVNTELMLADLESVERRLEPVEKRFRGGEKALKAQYELLQRAAEVLREGRPARTITRTA